MKGHFGVDSRSKLIHAVQATPANVADSTVLPKLLHGQETRVWGDQAYRGQRGVNHLLKSVVREIRTLRSVGTGGGRPPSVTRWGASNGRPYCNRCR